MNFKVSILAMVVGALGVFSTGCGDACGDLVDKCVECGGTQASCDIYADQDDDACEAVNDALDASGSCGG